MADHALTTLRMLGVGQLAPGFHRRKLVKHGPWVGCELRHGPPADPETGELLERSWRWQAFLDGEYVGSVRNEDDETHPDVFRVWEIFMSPRISRDDYDDLLHDADYARRKAPGLPEAKPRVPIDLTKMKSLV